ncbi:MAG: hypothetical protein HY741_03180 [Chloroflexi bacterium]|nr:hypothetical protein [Chloroflexota bacterium]
MAASAGSHAASFVTSRYCGAVHALLLATRVLSHSPAGGPSEYHTAVKLPVASAVIAGAPDQPSPAARSVMAVFAWGAGFALGGDEFLRPGVAFGLTLKRKI